MKMFKRTLQESADLNVERLRLSATAAYKYSISINGVLSRRDRPHNIGITTLLFKIDMCMGSFKSLEIEGRETGPKV